MSEIKCLGCGERTNTTMCDWFEHSDRQPRRCWVRYDEPNNLWVWGCSYDQLPEDCFEKKFADGLIGTKAIKSVEEKVAELEELIENGRISKKNN